MTDPVNDSSGLVCRYCGSTDRLTKRWNYISCAACTLERRHRCQSCHLAIPDVEYHQWYQKRCQSCERKNDERKALAARRAAVLANCTNVRSNPSHMIYIRSLPCAVGGMACKPIKVHACHVIQLGLEKNGLIADDRLTIPLCNVHHIEAWRSGWERFALAHGLELAVLACSLAAASPYVDSLPDVSAVMANPEELAWTNRQPLSWPPIAAR